MEPHTRGFVQVVDRAVEQQDVELLPGGVVLLDGLGHELDLIELQLRRRVGERSPGAGGGSGRLGLEADDSRRTRGGRVEGVDAGAGPHVEQLLPTQIDSIEEVAQEETEITG